MALHESYLPVFIFGFSRLWQNTLIGVDYRRQHNFLFIIMYVIFKKRHTQTREIYCIK